MSGERLGRGLLRLDAAYCAAGGLIAVALSRPLASMLNADEVVLVVLGALALGWAVALLFLARLPAWRRPVAAVATINLGAALAIGVLALVSPAAAAQLLLAAVALEVAALAAGQLIAARTGWGAATRTRSRL